MRTNKIKILSALLLMSIFFGCEENDPTPGYTVLGRSYETIAHITVSNNEPVVGETITIDVSYVNYSEDPAESVTYIIERGETQTTEDTTDETSTGVGEVVHSYSYTIPNDSSGETITFIGEFRSGMDYPQVEKVSVEVQ